MIYAGIDPGLTGGLAFLTSVQSKVVKLEAVKMPTWRDESADRSKLNLSRLREIFLEQRASGDQLCVYIEMAQAMFKPHGKKCPVCKRQATQGSIGTVAHYLEGYGQICGMMFALNISYREVSASSWKKVMGLWGQDKQASIERAKTIFPKLKDHITTKGDHGRAEAILLAEYARWSESAKGGFGQ